MNEISMISAHQQIYSEGIVHAFEGFGQISIVCIQKYFPSNFVLPGRIVWRIISSGVQKDNKSNLYDFLLYINVIISYSFRVCKNESHHIDEGCHLYSSLVSIIQTWWLGTTIHTHSDSEYATQADWVTESNASLRSLDHSRCDQLILNTWFHSNRFKRSPPLKHRI